MVHNKVISIYHSFIQQILRSYCMLGTVLDAGDTMVLPLWSLQSSEGDRQ